MLTGLLDASEGDAFICGYHISKEAAQAKAILAYVPDQPKLYGKLTAREFLQLVAALYRMPKEVSNDRARQLLAMFNLLDRADELMEGYSHGMRQKVVLAAALIHQPRVILLDEPTVGIDPQSRNHILETVRHLKEPGFLQAG